MGTPPNKLGVPLCQRSQRGFATHPRLRQIQTVSATNAPLRTTVPRKTMTLNCMMFAERMGERAKGPRLEQPKSTRMPSRVHAVDR